MVPFSVFEDTEALRKWERIVWSPERREITTSGNEILESNRE